VTAIIDSHAYRLVLPETMKIHNVFHANLLNPVKEDEEFKCSFAPAPPVIIAEGRSYIKGIESWIKSQEFGSTGLGGKVMGPLMTPGSLKVSSCT
jgi:hypothetical protein